MRCPVVGLVWSLCLVSIVGCGGSSSEGPAAVSAAGAVPSDPIARVVYDFFDAVRQGRSTEANRLLTPLALQRITELDMNIAPPGSPTARFRVGAVKTVQNDHALIELTWTDLDADGQPYDEPILCELRICDGQWRICGMAQDLGPDQPPMILDFESLPAADDKQPAAAGTTVATPAASGSDAVQKEIARDPFQQPVQR